MGKKSAKPKIVAWLFVMGLVLAMCIVSGLLVGRAINPPAGAPLDPLTPADTAEVLQRIARRGIDAEARTMLVEDPGLRVRLARGDRGMREALYVWLLSGEVRVQAETREAILAEQDPRLIRDWILSMTRQIGLAPDEILLLAERATNDVGQLETLLRRCDAQPDLLDLPVRPTTRVPELLLAAAKHEGVARRSFLADSVRGPGPATGDDPFTWLYERRGRLQVVERDGGWVFEVRP